ncbi:MAG: TRAP transporter small permease subunit [Alphaproteobacteria bacterium]|nr:TRAP transporter small permease subunit [Alphaproteobacteria bacterium]
MDWIDRVTKIIDRICIGTGKASAWLIMPMFLVLVWEVTVRKLVQPTIWANDIATMAYGAHFSLAAAYALCLQKHIRTDFISQHLSLRTQVRMDIAQYILFFLPGIAMFAWLSWEFAAESWELKEQLVTTWRPPAYLYKTIIPITAALLLLQGVAEVLKCIKTLRTGIDYRHQAPPGEVT